MKFSSKFPSNSITIKKKYIFYLRKAFFYVQYGYENFDYIRWNYREN
ncbi:hypothetical protein LEQ41_05945 [Streptococcus agalactiae]|nr:hypothetical protein [Streptococcus agalactiae]